MKSSSLPTQSILSFLSRFLIGIKHKQDTSQFNQTESINDEGNCPFQANANKEIQRVQEHYFLERRTSL